MLCAGPVQGHRANKLLAALEPEDFACLKPHLEIVNLQQGQVLCETGQPLPYAYFPHNIIISLMAVMHDGRSAEMSVFGSEGVTGLTGAAVTNQAFGRYVVQITGTASRIKIAKMHEVVSTRPAIQRQMRHFMEAQMARVLQNVACNAIHSVEARCARLILSTSHRVDQGMIPLTHEFWAERLGTQRSTISAIMKRFQAAGWVRQGRGGITITDPTALREVSCECYQRVHDVFVRLLPYTAKED
ncbi:Crp/Fnr family transcriptional regulator [Microvirga aerilata]|uniref:Crp/Fnr family transcriptional regulator n=2 Tax=Microvirga aerilata TaxID=670292 RepID=A0A936ZKQ6_9HYPH|nr:Crp/Fnr family transcriptional regulator [Microvirga aerilata]